MSNQIYADYAAATPTDPRVAAAMAAVQAEQLGNPSSAHAFGRQAAAAVGQARAKLANFINAKPEEVYITASGTESNNLAILGVARANKEKGRHIITSAIEHPSILNACRALEKDGWEVTYLPVNSKGILEPSALIRAIRPTTVLFTTHWANNEIGVTQTGFILEFGDICQNNGIYFHVDACQATQFEKIDVKGNYIDLLTFNGSKMSGPKGVAALYVRDGVPIFPLVYGGGQEQSLRSGTENVPGIVGLAKAAELIEKQRQADADRIGGFRDQLETELKKIAGVQINVAESPRLPNHLSVTLKNRINADLVREMDQLGVAVSAGSACSSKSLGDSHVLTAIGLTSTEASATIRISLGRATTPAEITTIAAAVAEIAKTP